MTVNAMKVTPQQAFNTLLESWKAQKDYGFAASHMLHGEPGVGKSQLVARLAKEIGADLYDIRLTTIETSDLRGLPYYDHETKTTKWYRPEDLPNNPERPAILFLDEITSCLPHLQPTVYGLLQERRVGFHKLPANTLIVAAGNGTSDGAVAYELGTAIADRMAHMEVVQSAESWIENFAIPEDLHPAVITFIKTRPDLLHTVQLAIKEDYTVATTGRSWEKVSNVLKFVKSREAQQVLIAGWIGSSVAAEFWLVADDLASTVKVLDMFKVQRAARIEMFPNTLHGLNSLAFGVIGHFQESNLEECVEILSDLSKLHSLRADGHEFRRLPIGELATWAFETLMAKGIKLGLADKFPSSPAYLAYHAEREELGLNAA